MTREKRERRVGYLVPKEHGSWAMWIVPFILGAVGAGRVTLPVVVSFAAFLVFFSARTALANAVRMRRRDPETARWLGRIGAAELLVGGILWAPVGWQWGLPFWAALTVGAALLAADLKWVRDRRERSLTAELLAVIAFSATAPAAYAAAAGHLDSRAWALWGLSAAFFAGSIFYVQMRLERRRQPHTWLGPNALATLGYTVLVTLLAVGFVRLGWISGWVAAALSPWLVHLLVDTLRPRPLASVHRLGWTLVAHSIGFTLLALLLLRFS